LRPWEPSGAARLSLRVGELAGRIAARAFFEGERFVDWVASIAHRAPGFSPVPRVRRGAAARGRRYRVEEPTTRERAAALAKRRLDEIARKEKVNE